MFGLSERLNANPWHALPAHLREGHGFFRANPGGHVVAADAGQRLRANWHHGAGVVWAARTEGWDARRFSARAFQRSFFVFDELEACFNNPGCIKLGDASGNHARNHCWRELTRSRKQPCRTRHLPLAVFVVFADHAWAHIVTPVIELLFHLVFDELAFFFHHQNFIQPHRKFAHRSRLQRPWHADLHQPNADLGGVALVDT